MKKILFAASECVPFIKTGGLADVAGSLPKNFDKDRLDVRVVLPKYACIKGEWKDRLEYRTNFYLNYNGRDRYVGILTLELDNVTFYFLDNEEYFGGGWPYEGGLWDIEKFGFFSKAVLCTLRFINFKPDVIHCHDWQTGLIPVYLDHFRFANPFYQDIRTVMTIHNLKFQGVWGTEAVMNITGLPAYYFTPDKLEAYRDANLLKGGIVYADRITTVSSTYAQEIRTPFYGERLDGLLNARSGSLSGIVNGIDYKEFNPESDPYIPYPYSADNFRKVKKKNKAALQKEMSLPQDPKAMMIGMVSRMTDQKGFDLIACVMEEMCADPLQFVVLGTGEERYENMFRHFAWKYPDKVSAHIYYSEEMAHKIYASSDAFLMPSLFEPCGLSQLMSLRFGTLPIVRETGGLKDTVEPFNEYEKTGTGFGFVNYNAHEMMAIVRYAEKIFNGNKREWNKMAERAMKEDFSWKKSAAEYEKLYNEL